MLLQLEAPNQLLKFILQMKIMDGLVDRMDYS